MSDQLKNRLVGALVLITLAVIFLPDILDGQKNSQEKEFSTIPLRPEFDTSHVSNPADDIRQEADPGAQQVSEPGAELDPIAEQVSSPEPANNSESKTSNDSQKQAEAVAQAKLATATPSQKTPAPVKTTPKKVNSLMKGNAWVVRLGGFKNAANVKALVGKLRKQGIKCFTLPEIPKDGTLTRVFVGPNIDRKVLEKQLGQLKELTKLSGSIVKYEPTAS